MKRLLLLIVPLIALFGMNQFSADAQSPLKVVATTSLIADVAQNVGGDLVDVTAIIPAGSDVHGYIATPQDIALIADADIVLVNGLGMEEGLLEILEENAPNAVIVSLGINVLSSDDDDDDDDNHDDEPVSTEEADHDDDDDHHEADYLGIYGVDVECDDHHEDDDHEKAYIGRNDDDDDHDDDHGACDPHVWQNPLNVMVWAENISYAFSEADGANMTVYAANLIRYSDELIALDSEIRDLINEIPEENRVIVTNHNFLAYFAAEYGFEVVGTVIPSASSMAQVAPRDIAELVEDIREEGVRAIFAEYAVSTDIAQTVADEVGYEVTVVRLYSDSLGEAGTYLDFIRYNVTAIVNALKG
ncbi:MAG: zinc ABC transporter substrate-binding protein [Anaerolineae bacterium]|nr:zinc ABC transporter substrate-binding protein [Anaerolineae bacterium]